MTIAPAPGPRDGEVLWLVWDCADLAGAYPTARQADAARADLIDRDVADFGPDPIWPDTVTILRVTSPTASIAEAANQ